MFSTTIADIRGSVESYTLLFNKRSTNLIAPAAKSTFHVTEDNLPADVGLITSKPFRAEIVWIVKNPFRMNIIESVKLDFIGNGDGVFEEESSDILKEASLL